jgi:hypothetical protein
MPEQLTKHPEVTINVLRSAGARCGDGQKQDILVDCPAERFCKLPGGELCVYGLDQASLMTQITPAEWQQLAAPAPASAPAAAAPPAATGAVLLGSAGLLVGLVIGLVVGRRARAPAPMQ